MHANAAAQQSAAIGGQLLAFFLIGFALANFGRGKYMSDEQEPVVPDVQHDPSAMLKAVRDYMRRSGVGGFLLEDPDGKFLVAAEPDLEGLHGLVKSQLQWERRHGNKGIP